MIVTSFAAICAQTAHDHEVRPEGAGRAGAGVGSARPAAQAQHGGDAAAVSHRRSPRSSKAEPERDDALGRVGVVAALVAPLLVGGMRRGPVEFRAHPVLLVEVVEVPVTGALPDPAPVGERQAAHAGVPPGERSGIPAADKAPSPASPSASASSRRQRIFLRASMAWRIRSAVVRLRPMARQIHAYASSKVGAIWIRSSTVSSTRVHGGSMAGCLVRRIASDRWMTTPGIFARLDVSTPGP